MKHSPDCVLIPLRELQALATALSIPIPTSISDITSRLPAIPAGKAGFVTIPGAVTATQTQITIAASGSFTPRPGDIIQINTGTPELMLVTGVTPPATLAVGPTLSVIRAFAGTSAQTSAGGAMFTNITPTALQLAAARINMALVQRSDRRVASGTAPYASTPYAWPFSPKPPSFTNPPMLIAGGQMINQTAQQGGVVEQPAPGGGTPNPSPSPSSSAQKQAKGAHR